RMSSDRGQAMVEFALVLPLLMLILLGIVQVGIAFKNYIELTDDVRAAARVAAVSRNDPDHGATAQGQLEADGYEDVQVDGGTWEAGVTVTVTAKRHYDINLLGLVVKSGDMTSTTKERVE